MLYFLVHALYMKLPLVSIIIATFNRADFIPETINSIRAQTYESWELVLIDDGSEDDTEQIVQSFNDRRIRFYKNQHSGILSKLMNEGIRYASGELIAIMASDDLWPADKIAKQVQALMNNPEAGFSLTNGYNFRNDASIPLEMFYKTTSGLECNNVFVRLCNGQISGFLQALIFWKHCIETTGYFSEKRSVTEVSFLANLAYHFKAVVLYEPLLMRRLHNENISGGMPKEESSDDFFEMIKTFKEQKKLPASIANNAIFKAYINIGEDYLRHEAHAKAAAKFIKAWRYKPFSVIPLKKILKTIIS